MIDPRHICAVIPTYGNGGTVADVVRGVLWQGLPVIVVDDGSTDDTAQKLEGLDIKTAEDRRHNLKFKPHKKNEDGEWSSQGGGRKFPTNNEEHYFKSKPFKDRPSKDKSYEEEEVNRKWGKDSRWKMFEAEDEEEAEIINRHLGKWGDRTIRPSRGGGKDSFEGRRGERDDRRPRQDGERPARKFDGQKGGGRPFRDKKKK